MKIIACHGWRGQRLDGKQRRSPAEQIGQIHNSGVALAEMDGGRTAASLRDMAADRLQRLLDAAKRSIIERTQTALQPCASGNCIADASGLHAPEAEQTLRSLRKRQCRGAAVKLHAGCKCVTTGGGGAEMCAAPLGGERHLGRARHHGAGQTGDHPGRKTRPEV